MDIFDILDAAYDLKGDNESWLQRLAVAASPFLPRGLSTVGYTSLVGPDWSSSPVAVSSVGNAAHEELCRRVVATMAGADLQRAYALGYASCSETFAAPFPPASVLAGVGDFLSVMAIDGDGASVVVGVTLDRPQATTPHDRAKWKRIGAHLASAMRLRRSVTGLAPREPDAIHTPGGRCVHAEGPTRSLEAREALRDAIARRERAKTSAPAASTEERLDLWQALVEGTWSLVDQEDSGGRRHVVAYRNPLPCSSDLSLSPREREVVQLIALGSTTKHAAYTLGVSPSAIAHRMRSALRKLRLPSAVELVKAYNHLRSGAGDENELRLTGDLVAHEWVRSRDRFPLTPKERKVRDLLAQGLSNREIAKQSACAERTVANHVASILRKTGASSRRDVVSKTE